jgi:hypothetical protein
LSKYVARHINQLGKAGIRAGSAHRLPASAVPRHIVHPATGEIAECNTIGNPEILANVVKARGSHRNVKITNDIDCGPFIS